MAISIEKPTSLHSARCDPAFDLWPASSYSLHMFEAYLRIWLSDWSPCQVKLGAEPLKMVSAANQPQDAAA